MVTLYSNHGMGPNQIKTSISLKNTESMTILLLFLYSWCGASGITAGTSDVNAGTSDVT